MKQVTVTQRRHYGKLEQEFSYTYDYHMEEGIEIKHAYAMCNEAVSWMFEDFETNVLPKIQYRQADAPPAAVNSRWFDAVSVLKEVKDGKEYIRVKTKPGTFYHKYGVAVYPECDGYDVLLNQLNGGYTKDWKPEQGAKVLVSEGENKKVVQFTIEVPF